jgi:CubicO group peptidase (beta-lactamase class C family)
MSIERLPEYLASGGTAMKSVSFALIIFLFAGCASTRESHYPGSIYGAVNDRGSIAVQPSGYADVARGRVLSETSSMHAFSLTKLFTSAAVVRFADEGKVDLDAPLTQYLPWVTYRGSVRQVLSHSSGIPDPMWGTYFIHWSEDHRALDRDAQLRKIVTEHPDNEFDPGTDVLYTNLGYALLGALLESIGGQSYESLIEEVIFKPLGMADAVFRPEGLAARGVLAKSYISRSPVTRILMGMVLPGNTYDREERWRSLRSDYIFDQPAHGGAILNSRDLAAFLEAVVRRDGALLSPEAWDSWLEPQSDAQGAYALGWRIEDTSQGRVFTHAGGAMGNAALVRYYPDRGVATYFQSNLLDSRRISQGLMDELDAAVLGDPAPREPRG